MTSIADEEEDKIENGELNMNCAAFPFAESKFENTSNGFHR